MSMYEVAFSAAVISAAERWLRGEMKVAFVQWRRRGAAIEAVINKENGTTATLLISEQSRGALRDLYRALA